MSRTILVTCDFCGKQKKSEETVLWYSINIMHVFQCKTPYSISSPDYEICPECHQSLLYFIDLKQKYRVCT